MNDVRLRLRSPIGCRISAHRFAFCWTRVFSPHFALLVILFFFCLSVSIFVLFFLLFFCLTLFCVLFFLFSVIIVRSFVLMLPFVRLFARKIRRRRTWPRVSFLHSIAARRCRAERRQKVFASPSKFLHLTARAVVSAWPIALTRLSK